MSARIDSLWWRLVLGLVLGAVSAVIVAGIFLFIRFKDISTESRDRTLQGQARLIAEYFKASGGRQVVLPDNIAAYYRDGIGKFAVVDAEGGLLAKSAGVEHPLHPIDPEERRAFFVQPEPEGRPAYHGISFQIKRFAPSTWVQVVFKDSEVIFDSALEEFVADIGWIWIPFVGLLLIINFIVIRIGLKPLAIASTQAAAIGPRAGSARLSEAGMPKEVLAFTKAINGALDRLEDGYKVQHAFIADAAHELRTPIAVISCHLDVIPDFEGRAELVDELNALKRLVTQLLDNARLEAMQIEPADTVDLNALAADVAAYLAPRAIFQNKNIEVAAAGEPTLINGAYDYLFRALRNLVENAIEHTPVNTVVTLSVETPATLVVADHGTGVPEPERKAIFQRFWQGKRDRGRGAGLGMAIVSRTIAGHKGTICVEDREGGGAVFTVKFPPLTCDQPTFNANTFSMPSAAA
jgi:signal transduction histidine kinase